MKLKKTQISDCYLLELDKRADSRGCFVKTYSEIMWNELNLKIDIKEDFYSISNKNALRGMHFQLPPKSMIKVVQCLKGKILDVILDLRVSSPSFKKVLSFELSEERPELIYVPSGCAHGFLSLEDQSLVSYKVSENFDPNLDSGLRWDSFGFDWGIATPQISERDRGLKPMADFLGVYK
jgi:dTDP-4-dehydrorhamnose 3,5-epimerase